MAALAAVCGATNIIYKTGRGRRAADYEVEPDELKMQVRWARGNS